MSKYKRQPNGQRYRTDLEGNVVYDYADRDQRRSFIFFLLFHNRVAWCVWAMLGIWVVFGGGCSFDRFKERECKRRAPDGPIICR